jgi:hypothetical protein
MTVQTFASIDFSVKVALAAAHFGRLCSAIVWV